MALDPTFDAALAAGNPLVFVAVEMVLPGGTLQLVDGAVAGVSFAGRTFTGRDDNFGVISTLDAIEDNIEAAAPRYRVTLLPKTLSAIGALMAATAQGSAVNIWFGAMNRVTGRVIGAPELLAAGEYDFAEMTLAQAERIVVCEVASVWERLFADSEGARLNDTWLQSLYPGALGLTYMVDGAEDPYWGANAPPPAVTMVPSGTSPFNVGG